MKNKARETALAKARLLRKEMTLQEKKLWEALRGHQFSGVKFRRQQPIGHYIVDFCSFEKRVIVELDGSQHGEHDQEQYDKERDQIFKDQGFKVLRFWNSEIDCNLEGVLKMIQKSLSTRGRGIKGSS